MITEQAQGLFAASPQILLQATIGGYAVLAVISGWIVFRIGAGKKWSRASFLVGFVLDVLWTASPPYRGIVEYLTDVPNLGLQSYAMYLLYTWPGYTWFEQDKQAVR